MAAITIATSATRDPRASDESRAAGTGSGRGSQRNESHTRFVKGGYRSNRSLLGEHRSFQDTALALAITMVTRAGSGRRAVGRDGAARGGPEVGPVPQGRGRDPGGGGQGAQEAGPGAGRGGKTGAPSFYGMGGSLNKRVGIM